ncbi:hypothetical protein PVAP13_2KG277537 [Panicum virgatum]|uniref:Uncharacterized protein n=1 Tax=Panicum virgatum TaxID=38727 RepID=A0A8T0WD22_PANVG|nr:hypothetical protein PVAP13_2KG277537 [Panicum virgatum]
MAARRRPRREGQRRRPGLRLGATGRAWASWAAWPGDSSGPAPRAGSSSFSNQRNANVKLHPPSIEPPAPSAVLPRVAEPRPPPPPPQPLRALGSRPPADPRARRRPPPRGPAGLQPASGLHWPPPRPWVPVGLHWPPPRPWVPAGRAGHRRFPRGARRAPPPAGCRRGRLQASSPPLRSFRDLASPLTMEVGG